MGDAKRRAADSALHTQVLSLYSVPRVPTLRVGNESASEICLAMSAEHQEREGGGGTNSLLSLATLGCFVASGLCDQMRMAGITLCKDEGG